MICLCLIEFLKYLWVVEVSISLKKKAEFSSMRAPNIASDSGFLPEKKLEKGEPHSE